MAQYEYLVLYVDILNGYSEAPAARRRGPKVVRRMIVEPYGNAKGMEITDEDGDDFAQFRVRIIEGFIQYLNDLGADGWQLVQYDQGFLFWPGGFHHMIRARSEKLT